MKIGKVKTEVVCLGLLTVAVFAGVLVSRFNGLPNRTFGYQANAQVFKYKGDWGFYHEAPTIPYGTWKMRTPTPKEFPEILFAGDSHVEQYYLRAKKLGKEKGISVGFVTNGGCLILEPVKHGYQENICRRASASFYELARDSRIKTIVIGQMWGVNQLNLLRPA